MEKSEWFNKSWVKHIYVKQVMEIWNSLSNDLKPKRYKEKVAKIVRYNVKTDWFSLSIQEALYGLIYYLTTLTFIRLYWLKTTAIVTFFHFQQPTRMLLYRAILSNHVLVNPFRFWLRALLVC